MVIGFVHPLVGLSVLQRQQPVCLWVCRLAAAAACLSARPFIHNVTLASIVKCSVDHSYYCHFLLIHLKTPGRIG